MMKAISVALALMASTPPAHAEEAAILGVGSSSCGHINDLYAAPDASIETLDMIISSWAAGFMTGVNEARSLVGNDTQNLKTLTWQNQVISIRRFCKHNPNKDMMAGVLEMYSHFSSNVDGK
jgi:hypothetical protein